MRTMGTARKQYTVRRILRTTALLAAATATAAAAFAAGSTHPVAPRHALADNGVINSKN
jgi:hypothetical protein